MAKIQFIAFALFVVSMAMTVTVTELFKFDSGVIARYGDPAKMLHKQWQLIVADRFKVTKEVDKFCRGPCYGDDVVRRFFCPKWSDMLKNNRTDKNFLMSPSVSTAFNLQRPKFLRKCCSKEYCSLADVSLFICLDAPIKQIYKRFYY